MRTILYGTTLMLLSLCGAAHAVPIGANLSGTITSSDTNSTDVAGLFGPVGASLAGQPIDVAFGYESDAFFSVGTGAYISLGGGPGISATVDGRTFQVFVRDPVTAGSVAFNADGTTAFLTVPGGSGGLSYGNLTLQTFPVATLTSLFAVTGAGSEGDRIVLSQGGRGFPIDVLNFTFNDPIPAPVPEPASIVLLGTGLIGLAVRYRRGLAS